MDHFISTRQDSLKICEPLKTEDYGLQAAAFTSPPKWHLAHTSWFFETFILIPFKAGYEVFNPAFELLFNSYYNAVGDQYPRPDRGLLSRPTVAEVLDYRSWIDKHIQELLSDETHSQRSEIVQRCELGIQHEKQHQELFFTDLKYSLFHNPLYPAYEDVEFPVENTLPGLHWLEYEGGLVNIGAPQDGHFAFDNERPEHKVYLEPFALASRLVTNAEYKEFIDDGGYSKPEYWLADGWATIQEQGWKMPLYWVEKNGRLFEFTLSGIKPLMPGLPVCHLSGYEADAYANWRGLRLPTEFEWEHAASGQNLAKDSIKCVHPHGKVNEHGNVLSQLYDSCWQWTSSTYLPYPRFQPGQGALGEYNGKFMCNQWVLRGGSCASPSHHVRVHYRNFFYPADRWQFSSIRLAKYL